MGKHKEKKKRKEKRHKSEKDKVKRKDKKEYSTSESSESTCSEDEWVEKSVEVEQSIEPTRRHDWLSLPGNCLTPSNKDLRELKKLAKLEQKQADQYNPGTNARELNPYWKNNGTGLPSTSSSPGFRKPLIDDDIDAYNPAPTSTKYLRKTSNWQKPKDTKNEINIRQHEDVPNRTLDKDERQTQVDECSKLVLSEKELNILAARLIKAEIMGNTSLIKELQEKLNNARNARAENAKSTKEEHVLLTQTDSKGYSRPLTSNSADRNRENHAKKRKVETHIAGERIKYFTDDDKYNLKQMFEQEKFNTVERQNKEFLSILGKNTKNDDLDEIFTDKIRNHEKDGKADVRNRNKAISEHSKMTQMLDNCNKCPSSDAIRKHLIVSLGTNSYLSLLAHEPLTEGHCLIAPIRHTICSTQLDENEWDEIVDFRKAVTRMCASRDEDVIFFEVARHLHRLPHMHIEAVPMKREIGDLAPIYFKKAIDESEHEWATNRKLIKLEGRSVRRAVPMGLPYFFVCFGMQEGFAHVIEDEEAFPANFAQEIIGGMLDLHHSRWRNPKRQSFQQQSDRVKEFTKTWRNFDPKFDQN